MNKKQEFIQAYEKKYKKIRISNACIFGLWLVILYGSLILFVSKEKSILLPSIGMVVLGWFIVLKGKLAYMKNVNTISQKWVEDFDVDFAESVYRELLSIQKRRDRRYILLGYLNLLFTLNRMEEFEQVYDKNRKEIQKIGTSSFKTLKEWFASILEDKSCFRQMMFSHSFSKYHKIQGELPSFKANLRFNDQYHEVQQLYLIGEYEKVVEKIEAIQTRTRYDHLLVWMLGERCLYHIKPDYVMPEVEYPEFLCVKRLKSLVDTGKEYYDVHAQEILDKIEQDCQANQKHSKKVIVGTVLFYVMVIIFVLTVRFVDIGGLSKGIDGFISELEKRDIPVSEVYCFAENDDISVAVIEESTSIPGLGSKAQGYSLMGVDKNDGKWIQRVEFEKEWLGFYLNKDAIYTFEGESSTYVMIAVEEDVQVYYDGELINGTCEKIAISDQQEMFWTSFIVEGKFDKDKLKNGESESQLDYTQLSELERMKVWFEHYGILNGPGTMYVCEGNDAKISVASTIYYEDRFDIEYSDEETQEYFSVSFENTKTCRLYYSLGRTRGFVNVSNASLSSEYRVEFDDFYTPEDEPMTQEELAVECKKVIDKYMLRAQNEILSPKMGLKLKDLGFTCY